MNFLPTIWRWLRSFGQRRVVKQEIDEELRFHIELRTGENIAAGMAPEEAASAARRRFGNVQSLREECRDVRGASFGETTLQDIRFGFRILRKEPGFATVAVLMLALGIGANTAIFSVVNAVLLQPLPYREPESIVMLWASKPSLNLGTQELPVEALDLPEWRDQARSFEQIAAFQSRAADLSEQGDPERVAGVHVTANLFHLLGTRPLLGRTFSLEEERPGNDKVVIISYGLWLRRFGGDTNKVGQLITVNRERRTVVGIMPPGFNFPSGTEMGDWSGLLSETEIWLPFAERADYWRHDENHVRRQFIAIGRIKPGIPLTQAQGEMENIARRQEKEHPVSHSGWTVQLRPLALQVGGGMRSVLFLLLGVVALVLVIACANVANLLLCRSAARQKEMAVRAAIGATRGRVIRQLLTESLLLSAFGGGVGLLLGTWGVRLILRVSPAHVPLLDEIKLDGHVLAFTALVALVTGIVFGSVPAWQVSRINLTEALNADGRSSTAMGLPRAYGLLVAAEVMLSVILLTGAGLMLKSLVRLQAVDPGFDPNQVATFELSLSGETYSNGARGRQFFREARERLAGLTRVYGAAAISALPLAGGGEQSGLIIEGSVIPPPGQKTPTEARAITPGYFKTMGVTLLRGRDFTDHDSADKPVVCIINETIARSFFPGIDPLGKRVRLGDGTPDEANNPFYSIVGIARDVRGWALETKPIPEVYLPLEQEYRKDMTFVVRSDVVSASSLERAIRSEMRSLDPALPVANYRTMERLVANAVARPRFSAFLFGLFAATALLLTVVGLYGVVAYAASQRTREIGVRIALGASRRNILALVIRQGMLPALAGLIIGIAGAFALTRLLAAQLYEVSPADPATFGSVIAVLLLATFAACWLPACRATKIDPMMALRYE